MKKSVLSLCLILALASSEGAAKKPYSKPQFFSCNDGTNFVITDLGSEAVVKIEDLEIRLLARKFSYGRRFVDDVTTLIVDGRKATVSLIGSDALIECTQARQSSRR